MPEGETIGQVLARVRLELAAGGIAAAAAEARILVMDSLSLTAADLYLRTGDVPPTGQVAVLRARVGRRLAGEPVFRILGMRAFYAHEFRLSADTLEPRPDTETLVDLAAEALLARFGRDRPFLFADVGTGSGAIAVSVLALFPMATCIGIDIADGALAMAAENAAAAGVGARFRTRHSDYLAAVPERLDAVLSNPPYIPSAEIAALDVTVRCHDPVRALDGGADGLDAYRRLAQEALSCLAPGGDLLLEIGAGQGADVRQLMAAAGLAFVRSADDLGGHERALWFRRDSR